MLKRIITAVVAIAVFVPVCIFSYTIVFPIVFGILCAIGVFEMAKCLHFEKNYGLTIPMYLVAFLFPIAPFFFYNSTFFALALLGFVGILIYVLAFVMFGKNQIKLSEILPLYAMFVYIVSCFSSITVIRYMSGYGVYRYLLIFIGAWICDTFAYFVGKFFGKNKLIPEISPKKTVEGSIGGIFFTVIAFVAYAAILGKRFGETPSYLKFIIMAIVLSVVSQIGDLLMSAVKRQYGIKDYGFIFPGHGGVLDRFDSVMLCAPVLYVMIKVLSIF